MGVCLLWGQCTAMGAVFAKFLRDALADSAGTAGDDGNFMLKYAASPPICLHCYHARGKRMQILLFICCLQEKQAAFRQNG